METKYCAKCDKTLPVESFGKAKSRYDGLQGYCSECMKVVRKEHYHANKKQYYDRNQKYKSELREFILEFKSHPCTDCGVSYPNEPWLMEIDHREPKEKEYNIWDLVQSNRRTKLLNEIKKCDLVCLICHRRRTAKAFSWQRNRFSDII